MRTVPTETSTPAPQSASDFFLAAGRIFVVLLVGPIAGGATSLAGAILLGAVVGPIGAIVDGQTSNMLGYTLAITVYLGAIAVLEGIPAGFLGALGIAALPWRESRSLIYAPAIFSVGTVGVVSCLIRVAENEPSGLPLWACLLLASNAAVGAIWAATPLGLRLAQWARPIPNPPQHTAATSAPHKSAS